MQEGLKDKKISYDWIVIVPMLALLLLVVIALAIIPNCLDRGNCIYDYPASPNVSIEKLSEELTVEEFMTDLKVMRAEIHEETLMVENQDKCFHRINGICVERIGEDWERKNALNNQTAVEINNQTAVEIADGHNFLYIGAICH